MQPAIFLGLLTQRGPFLFLRKGKQAQEGGVEPRLAMEEYQGQGAGRLFVAKGRGTHNTPSPRKLTSYLTPLERYTVRWVW